MLRILLVLVAVCLILPAQSLADDANVQVPVEANLIKGKILAPTATVSSTVQNLSKSRDHGIDWNLTSDGTPHLRAEIFQCNKPDGEFRKWSSPNLAGVTVNTSQTITTDVDGSGFSISPSGWAIFVFTNDDNSSVTINRIGLFHQ